MACGVQRTSSMMATIERPLRESSSELREWMLADHAEIEGLFSDTVAAFKSGDRDVATATFTQLDRRLEAHLDVEDDVLLPALAHAYPAEAAALTSEHQRIRARLVELGVACDLHLARATWVAEFIELLRGHARREDELLYRWASAPAAPVDVPAVMARLRAV